MTLNSLCRICVLTSVLLAGVCLHAGEVSPSEEGLPLFQGILDDAKSPQFGLSRSDKSTVAWVKIGQSFDGWKIEEHRRDDDVLVLSKDGRKAEINLATAKLVEIPFTDGARALAEAMGFEIVFPRIIAISRANSMQALLKELAKRGVRNPTPEQMALLEQTLDRELQERFSAEQLMVDLTKAMSETFTPEELRGQRVFWESDTGKTMLAQLNASEGKTAVQNPPPEFWEFLKTEEGRTLLAKQGEMNQRFLQALMPRNVEAVQAINRVMDSIAPPKQ